MAFIELPPAQLWNIKERLLYYRWIEWIAAWLSLLHQPWQEYKKRACRIQTNNPGEAVEETEKISMYDGSYWENMLFSRKQSIIMFSGGNKNQ